MGVIRGIAIFVGHVLAMVGSWYRGGRKGMRSVGVSVALLLVVLLVLLLLWVELVSAQVAYFRFVMVWVSAFGMRHAPMLWLCE